MYRLARLSLWDVVRIGLLAGSLWQLLFREKAFAWLQRLVFWRFPPDGYAYPGGQRTIERVPYRSGRPRLMRWNPAGGTLRQSTDEQGRPLWYRYKGDSGQYEPDELLPDVPAVFTEWLPQISDPIIDTEGAWVVPPGHGSKIGNFLNCPACPTLWAMILGFTAAWWPLGRAWVLAAGGVAVAWQAWTTLNAVKGRL